MLTYIFLNRFANTIFNDLVRQVSSLILRYVTNYKLPSDDTCYIIGHV